MPRLSTNQYSLEHARVTILCRRCQSEITVDAIFERDDEPVRCKCGREWDFDIDIWGWQEAEGE